MIKTLATSLLLAATMGQTPPGVAIPPPPVIPAAPVTPTEPAVPVVPATPTQPAVPATPTEPAVPSVPVTPTTPAVPATPVTTLPAAPVTTVPVAPVTTAPPATTTKPAAPINPNWVPITPTDPASPTTTVKPATTTAAPLLPPGHFWGSFGQVCVPDPLKDVTCKAAGEIATDKTKNVGFLKCERAYDCCLCGSVVCGDAWKGCNTFSVGDSGIQGVQDVKVVGQLGARGGAEILCIGIEGCADSKIVAYNVKVIDAAGDLSMRNAVVTVTNPVADFTLDCVGMGGCQDLKIELVMPGPPPGYQCNPALDPTPIEFGALQCSGRESCRGLDLTIRNNGCFPIEIQNVECVHQDSCIGASFTFIGDIEINNCDIAGVPPAGLEHCFSGNLGGGGYFMYGNPHYSPYWMPL